MVMRITFQTGKFLGNVFTMFLNRLKLSSKIDLVKDVSHIHSQPTFDQNFNTLRYEKRSEKNYPRQRYQEYLFCKIIILKKY